MECTVPTVINDEIIMTNINEYLLYNLIIDRGFNPN